MKTYPTKDIKLAAILISLGIPYRKSDPVTRELIQKNGKDFEQITFWFDVEDQFKSDYCGQVVKAYALAKPFFETVAGTQAGEYLLDPDHPLYYMMGCLFNRETLFHWMRHNAEPMRIINHGKSTVIISARASDKLKAKIKEILK